MGRGMKQLTLAAVGFERYAKTTRRAAFLVEMERVVPWSALCGLIEPVYPKPGNGRPPVGVERMLRIYFLQQWFNLSDRRWKRRSTIPFAARCRCTSYRTAAGPDRALRAGDGSGTSSMRPSSMRPLRPRMPTRRAIPVVTDVSQLQSEAIPSGCTLAARYVSAYLHCSVRYWNWDRSHTVA